MACNYIHPTVSHSHTNQETQTTQTNLVSDRDTRAQYTSSSEDSDSESSDYDENIEGTENITVTKRYLNNRSLSSEDIYTAPVQPPKRFCTSTPEPYEHKPEKEPPRCPLKEIINHNGALQIPPVDIIVAPGQRGANAQRVSKEYKRWLDEEDSKTLSQIYRVPIRPLCKSCS